MKVLALDAMGVIYQARDDVEELLIPFVSKHKSANQQHLQYLYHQCSLGKISSSFFWKQIGLSPELEDEYLSNHQLVNGVKEYLVDWSPTWEPITNFDDLSLIRKFHSQLA